MRSAAIALLLIASVAVAAELSVVKVMDVNAAVMGTEPTVYCWTKDYVVWSTNDQLYAAQIAEQLQPVPITIPNDMGSPVDVRCYEDGNGNLHMLVVTSDSTNYYIEYVYLEKDSAIAQYGVIGYDSTGTFTKLSDTNQYYVAFDTENAKAFIARYDGAQYKVYWAYVISLQNSIGVTDNEIRIATDDGAITSTDANNNPNEEVTFTYTGVMLTSISGMLNLAGGALLHDGTSWKLMYLQPTGGYTTADTRIGASDISYYGSVNELYAADGTNVYAIVSSTTVKYPFQADNVVVLPSDSPDYGAIAVGLTGISYSAIAYSDKSSATYTIDLPTSEKTVGRACDLLVTQSEQNGIIYFHLYKVGFNVAQTTTETATQTATETVTEAMTETTTTTAATETATTLTGTTRHRRRRHSDTSAHPGLRSSGRGHKEEGQEEITHYLAFLNGAPYEGGLGPPASAGPGPSLELCNFLCCHDVLPLRGHLRHFATPAVRLDDADNRRPRGPPPGLCGLRRSRSLPLRRRSAGALGHLPSYPSVCNGKGARRMRERERVF